MADGRTVDRIGVKHRIWALGLLGVLGLLLVGGIYLAGNSSERRLQHAADVANFTDTRFSAVLASLADARQSETAFLLTYEEAQATLHDLALARAQTVLSSLADIPEPGKTTRAGIEAVSSSLSTYTARSDAAMRQQRTLGPVDGNGLLHVVVASAQSVLQAILQSGDPGLTAQLVVNRQHQGAFILHPDTKTAEACLRDAEMQIQAIQTSEFLTSATRSALADRVASYSRDLTAYTAAKLATLDAIFASRQAFEAAQAAGGVAQGVATSQAELNQSAVVRSRASTDLMMRIAIGVVAAAVAALAWRIGRGISRPLAFVAWVTRSLAGGDRNISIEYTSRRDEIGDVARALAAFRDVLVEKHVAAQRIYHLAHHDDLTGLANRTMLYERLSAAIGEKGQRGGSLAVLCLDLDGFKAINDLHGHRVGDQLLREVSMRLETAVRGGDLAARLGGDEFVVVQDEPTDPDAVRAFAERLVALMAAAYLLDNENIQASITTSIGIALFPRDGNDPEELLRNADTALYRAKWAGKNGFAFFQPEMDRDLREQRALEASLQHALERKEFALAWQPIAETGGANAVTGFEVLLRWQHPVRGLVSPDVFIPMAESSGMIRPIGAWVLQTACDEATRWPNPLCIAVNVSPLQAQQGEVFATMVERVLETSKLAPSRLMLEVTEGVLIREPGRVLAALRRLKAIGVRIALDDFGTGYSSLATLRAFPFDKIKIDRSFVSGLATGGQDCAIVKAVSGLASGLGLPVVAEGVETREQLAILRDAGCDEVQGWLIGRPASIETFSALVEAAMPARHQDEVSAQRPIAERHEGDLDLALAAPAGAALQQSASRWPDRCRTSGGHRKR